MEYGYARIATREQNERRQVIALQNFGIGSDKIYVDRQSGKNFERTQYATPAQVEREDIADYTELSLEIIKELES